MAQDHPPIEVGTSSDGTIQVTVSLDIRHMDFIRPYADVNSGIQALLGIDEAPPLSDPDANIIPASAAEDHTDEEIAGAFVAYAAGVEAVNASAMFDRAVAEAKVVAVAAEVDVVEEIRVSIVRPEEPTP